MRQQRRSEPGPSEPGPSEPGPSEPGPSERWWRRRWWLATEYALVFFVLIGGWTLLGIQLSPIPFLLVGGLAAWWYLRRRPGFARRDLWRPEAVRPALWPVLGLWAGAGVAFVVVVALVEPHKLFDLPRQQPLLWAAVAVFYPVFSVYPQELIFRAWLMERYAPLFGSGWGVVAASAAAFGFAHIIYGSIWSVVLTLAGGWLFARRFQRTRSLAVAFLEHSLYGVLAFTVGLGDLFYRGLPTS